MNRTWLMFIVLLLGLPAGVAVAAPAAMEWNALSEDQQRVLRQYQPGWLALDDAQRQRLALGSERWLSMDQGQRQAVTERFQRWRQLPEAQRQRLLQRFQQFRELSPQQQRQIRTRLRRYNNLSPERKQQLRQRFQQMSPADRSRALERLRNRARPDRGPGRQAAPGSREPRSAGKRNSGGALRPRD